VAHDKDSRLTQVSDPTGTYGFSYDHMGRLATTTVQYAFLTGQTFTNTYSYDAGSNRTGYTAPDGSTNSYTYDTLNRLTNLSNSWAGAFGFSYDSLSRRTSMTRPNNISTNYSYDSLSRLLSVLHQAGGTTTIDGATYTVDNVGNRLSKTNQINSTTDNYTYDLIYQLTQVAQAGNTTESYAYDAVGNRQSSLGVSPYSYDNSNQLTSTPSATFTHDNNGNTLTKVEGTDTTSYAWDFENRMTSVTLPASGGVVSFKYDPVGRRIQKTFGSSTTNYIYDGAGIAEEVSGSGTILAKYAQGEGIDEPMAMSRSGAILYYHADGLGTITSLTDGSGSAQAAYTYDSFGKQILGTGSVTNPFRYTGRELDQETGLYYYRARYYDQNTGRFLTEDPLGHTGGINFYEFVSNDPSNRVDPLGLRDILVLTWNRRGKSVGHVVAMEMDGKIILSQFPGNPSCHCRKGPNTPFTWAETLKEEGRQPDGVFKVYVPDDYAFNNAALDQKNRPTWNWVPNLFVGDDETNCVYAVARALESGGVPVPDSFWPGNFDSSMRWMQRRHKPRDKWNVSPGKLPSNLRSTP